MQASSAGLARVSAGRGLPEGGWRSEVARSEAEGSRRGCAARGRACRGDGVRDGVDDVATAPVMDGGVVELGHAWIKQEQGEIWAMAVSLRARERESSETVRLTATSTRVGDDLAP
jgi:hypothetical protein